MFRCRIGNFGEVRRHAAMSFHCYLDFSKFGNCLVQLFQQKTHFAVFELVDQFLGNSPLRADLRAHQMLHTRRYFFRIEPTGQPSKHVIA